MGQTATQVSEPGLLRTVGAAAGHWLARRFNGKAQAVSSYTGPIPLIGKNRYGLSDTNASPDELIKAFRSIVFACIHARAKEVANKGHFIVKVKVKQDEYQDVSLDHPLAVLLDNPNPYFTRYDLLYLMTASLDIFGNSYWWAPKIGTRVAALWPMPAQSVGINRGNSARGEGIIKSYSIKWDGETDTEIPAEDVIHLRHVDPANPYFAGASLMMRAAQEIDIQYFITDHWREFFANSAMPSYLINTEEQLDDDVRSAFVDQWADKYRRKPGQFYLAEGGKFTIQPLQSEKELSYIDSIGVNVKTIRGVFGVPASKLMDTEVVTARATAEAVDYTFQAETIDPLLTMIDQQLTKDLAQPLYDSRLIVIHRSTIPKDQQAQAQLDKLRLESGVASINEVRRRNGDPDVTGGEEPLVNGSLVRLSSKMTDPNAAPTEPTPAPKNARKTIALKDLTEDQKVAHWKGADAFRMHHEVRLTRKLKAYFNDIRDEVVSNVRSGKSKMSEEERMNFDVHDWLRKLIPVMTEQTHAILEAAFKQFADQYNVEGITYAPNTHGVMQAVVRVNQKTVTVPQTLHDELAKELSEGLRLNESVDQIAARVAKFFDNTNDYRAQRIARTVSNYGVNEGNRLAALEAGFTMKSWLSMRDANVRDTHQTVDGQKVKVTEKFTLSDGDMLDVPGDPNGQPGNTISCRCTVLFSKK